MKSINQGFALAVVTPLWLREINKIHARISRVCGYLSLENILYSTHIGSTFYVQTHIDTYAIMWFRLCLILRKAFIYVFMKKKKDCVKKNPCQLKKVELTQLIFEFG